MTDAERCMLRDAQRSIAIIDQRNVLLDAMRRIAAHEQECKHDYKDECHDAVREIARAALAAVEKLNG